jgi:hypothetical protein
MQAHAAIRPGASFAAATATVTALHEAGVAILAGTDAVTTPGMPVQVLHGESLHQELELLLAADLVLIEGNPLTDVRAHPPHPPHLVRRACASWLARDRSTCLDQRLRQSCRHPQAMCPIFRVTDARPV